MIICLNYSKNPVLFSQETHLQQKPLVIVIDSKPIAASISYTDVIFVEIIPFKFKVSFTLNRGGSYSMEKTRQTFARFLW
jgi:hypothetical protein